MQAHRGKEQKRFLQCLICWIGAKITYRRQVKQNRCSLLFSFALCAIFPQSLVYVGWDDELPVFNSNNLRCNTHSNFLRSLAFDFKADRCMNFFQQLFLHTVSS
jgi:hypothetical protein